MSKFVIGGWTQDLQAHVPKEFSYTMYGMVTNLSNLTTGGGWGPATTAAPTSGGQVLWTYGGQFCSPNGYPSTQAEFDAIVNACTGNHWAGVDFDDECGMNTDGVGTTIKQLASAAPALGSSYTFLAGWAFNNPDADPGGKKVNEMIAELKSGPCNRFVMMCYGGAMWDPTDYEKYVPLSIDRMLHTHEIPASKVILALTPRGLNATNLSYFLNQVTFSQIGGLFVWDFTALSKSHLDTIRTALVEI